MRYTSVAIALVLAVCLGSTTASANMDTTFVLHAAAFAGCPGDVCPDNVVVSVDASATSGVFLLIRNYTNIAGVQTAFDDGGTGWIHQFGVWSCQSNQLSAVTPSHPWGPTDGTLASAFDAIASGATAAIGGMQLTVGPSGCLTQVQSSFPAGTHVVDSEGAVTQINVENLGSVCVGTGGVNACTSAGTPVENATWGGIKAQYQ